MGSAAAPWQCCGGVNSASTHFVREGLGTRNAPTQFAARLFVVAAVALRALWPEAPGTLLQFGPGPNRVRVIYRMQCGASAATSYGAGTCGLHVL